MHRSSRYWIKQGGANLRAVAGGRGASQRGRLTIFGTVTPLSGSLRRDERAATYLASSRPATVLLKQVEERSADSMRFAELTDAVRLEFYP